MNAADIALENLSVADKILLMERLWEDLSRRPSDVPSPDWHGDILAERAGSKEFISWDAAKKRLRERFS
jgi:hypothetical protein